MQPLPDPRLSPRESVLLATTIFGSAEVIAWCEELLTGRVGDDDPNHPDIRWLCGTRGWPIDDPVVRVRRQAWRALGGTMPS